MKKLLLGALAGGAIVWAASSWITSPPIGITPAVGNDITIALECRGIEIQPFATVTVEEYEKELAQLEAAIDKGADDAAIDRLKKSLYHYTHVNTYFDHATISVEKGRVVAAEAGLWHGAITVATPTRIEFEARKWQDMPNGPKRYGVIDRTTGVVNIHDSPLSYASVDQYKNSTEVAFDFRCHPAATKF